MGRQLSLQRVERALLHGQLLLLPGVLAVGLAGGGGQLLGVLAQLRGLGGGVGAGVVGQAGGLLLLFRQSHLSQGWGRSGGKHGLEAQLDLIVRALQDQTRRLDAALRLDMPLPPCAPLIPSPLRRLSVPHWYWLVAGPPGPQRWNGWVWISVSPSADSSAAEWFGVRPT